MMTQGFHPGRRQMLVAAAIATLEAVRGIPVRAQEGSTGLFPSRPVRLLVPYPAGGVADVVVRGLALGLQSQWGQPVVVDNKPGGNEIIAAELLARAAPDGTTLMMAGDAVLWLNQLIYAKLPYQPERDFAPVTRVGIGRMGMFARGSLPVRNLQELVAYANANPGKLSYASSGIGSTTHLAMEWFRREAGIDIVHVPYKGAAPAIQDMLANVVDLAIIAPTGIAGYIERGQLKGLGISGPRRQASLPAVPTFAEAGYPSMSADFSFGLLAPAGTPAAIVARIAADAGRVVQTPAFTLGTLRANGLDPVSETPADFAAHIAAERPRATARVKASGARFE